MDSYWLDGLPPFVGCFSPDVGVLPVMLAVCCGLVLGALNLVTREEGCGRGSEVIVVCVVPGAIVFSLLAAPDDAELRGRLAGVATGFGFGYLAVGMMVEAVRQRLRKGGANEQ